MSEPTKLATGIPPGLYEIISLAATGNPLTGVGHHKPTWYPVHVDATIHIWRIEPQRDRPGVYRLSLQSPYPYTGVKDDTVIVTDEKQEDIDWHIYHLEEDIYAIASRPIRPAFVWTLGSSNPNSEIKIRLWGPGDTQRFRIVPVNK